MVTILDAVERRPSFSSRLGGAIGQGVERGLDFASQLGVKKAEQQEKMKLANALLGNSMGQEEDSDPFMRAKQAALLGEAPLSRVLSEEARTSEKQRFAREQAAEPKLLEMEDKLRGLDESSMRFERLGELFSPDLEGKFPSSLSAALFTKDGELRPLAAASLSPEAQEATKLVADELKSAKETFGSRVTNFDIQSYMKRLPTLLNSSEGRRRVLRDLQLMNDINRMHHEGVLDVIDRYGGPGKISVSKAERIFKKEFAPKIKELREEFVRPDKKSFSDLPSASNYAGRKMVDEDTGQVFVSDGRNWVPEGE